MTNLTARDRRATVALASVGQRQLWMHDRLFAHDGSYNILLGVRLIGALDEAALERALNLVIARHEPLRTTFSLEDDDVHQVIADTLEVSLPVVRIQAARDEDVWAQLHEALERDGARPFDLAAGPLMRPTLYRVDATTHALTLILHHTVFDGWSVGILLDELGAFYDAVTAGRQADLPALEIQFADFAEWQRERLDSEASRPGLDYWGRQLEGAPRHIALPFDRPAGPGTARRGRIVRATAPVALRAELGTLCRTEHCTLFMVLMSAFAVVLHRYARQSDVLIGTPVAGRTREEFESLIGVFINTVLIRSRVDDTTTFSDLVRLIRTATLDAQTHQDIPFDRVQDLMQRDGGGDRFQLQVLLALQSATPEPKGFGGLDVSLFWGHNGTAKNDLFLNLIDDSAGLRYELEYDCDLFDESTARRLLDSFEVVLEAAAAGPGTPIVVMPILSDDDRSLMARTNATAAPYPSDATVHALFEAQTARTPDRLAVAFGDRRCSYAELNRRANRIAQTLRRHGAGPGMLVGLCVTRSDEMVAAVLGVLKSGAAYVPIDPNYPAERIALVLEDSGAPLLLTEAALAPSLPASRAEVILLEDLDATSEPVAGPEATAEDLAYVLYTSGSTGRPKGVEVPHRAFVNFLVAMQKEPGFSQHDWLLAVTTLSFDIAGLELLLPLVSGGSLTVAPWDAVMDPRQLQALLEGSRITVMQATPITWRMLLEAGWAGNHDLTILCGGEAMPSELAAALRSRCAALWNMYGPTETTIWSLVRRIVDDTIDIGTPIANTDVVVVDDHMQPAPVGVPGELLIGGDGLARGYHGRADLTADRFVAHPIFPVRRAYRTGDLCRWRADGRIDYLGRLDHQVKIRGFRIELGEIETQLAQHQDVRQAVVVAREDRPGDRRLVAYVTVTPGAAPSSEALRAHLARTLPEYMLPSAFVTMHVLPQTPNGKIDRKALPEPTGDVAAVAEAFVAPRTPTEEQLAAVWSQVLEMPRIGTTDNFFHLGGHSLMAIRLFARIRDVMELELPFGLLLQHPTIGALAAAIDQQRGMRSDAPPVSALTALRPTGSRPPIFFTHGIGGEVWSFTALTRHLGDDQPVYGLQPVHDPAGHELSVVDIAGRYIQEIRTVSPRGPYLLGGHCAGAAVAFEMARQLRAAGEDVGLVAVIDYWLVDTIDRRLHVRTVDFLRNLPRWIQDDLVRVSPATVWGRVKSAGRILAAKWRRALTRSEPSDAGPSIDIRDRLGMWRFPDYQVAALERAFKMFQEYKPQPYDGDILLIRARTLPLFPVRVAPDMGWRSIVSGAVTIRDVAGSHETILQEPLVEGVAAVLREQVDRVMSEGTSRSKP